MRSTRHPRLALAAILAGALPLAAACGHPVSPPPPTGDSGDTTTTTSGDSTSTTTTDSATTSTETMPDMACKLSSPVKSADRCSTDADCGVSDPCHAHACVAKSKAHPPDKSTICTQLMDCRSADANTCGCLEGVCALFPPKN